MNVFLKIILSAVFLIGVASTAYGQQGKAKLSDQQATPEAKKLYQKLKALTNKGIMFGHQDDMAYGLGWKYEENRSDVKSVTGSYPAVYGWDLGHLELGNTQNLDSVPFDKMKILIKKVHDLGGINTISWHLNNPVNGKSSWDKSNTVSKIIPGGSHHQAFKAWLDRIAIFLGDLKDSNNKSIPVLFRPYHEHTGSWFWWGEDNCSANDYKELWRFTVDYLRNEKKLHHLIFVYSSSRFKSEAHYLERYPGNEYIDMVGFDTYVKPKEYDYKSTLVNQLAVLKRVAERNGKLAALTETGYSTIPDAQWWTGTLLPLLANHKLSYVLVWRNARPDHHYAPFPGHLSAPDFIKFYEDERIIFLDRLKKR
jgi:mannan endo-1,4-beta-mannosidase